MKKYFTKIISLMIVTVLAMFTLSGCQLIVVNAERDMAQDIAVVEIDPALREVVKKKDLVSAYNSEGYYYVEYQGYDSEEVYTTLLEGIIKNKILIQQARISLTDTSLDKDGNPVGYFAKAKKTVESTEAGVIKTSTDYMLGETKNYKGDAFTTVTKTDSLDKFLTKYEYERINYAILSSIKQLVDNYKEADHDHKHDAYEAFKGEVRTVLSMTPEKLYNEYEMQNDEEAKVITKDSDFYKSFAKIIKDAKLNIDVDSYVYDVEKVENKTKFDLAYDTYKAYNDNFDLNEEGDRSAVTKLIRDLKKLGFVSGSFNKVPSTKDDFLAIAYFNDTLQSQYESEVINKYKNALQNDEEKKLADDKALYQAYKNVYNSQKAKYENDYSAYETALSNASDTNIVFYHPEVVDGKYGYVLNLLIGFSDEEKAIYDAVAESPKLTATQKSAALSNLLTHLTAKDLRSSWVESNYGKFEKGTFTFDERYVKTPALQTYVGTILGEEEYTYHDSYDNEVIGHTYKAVKGTEISFVKFYNDYLANTELMGFSKQTDVAKLNGHSGKIDLTDKKVEIFKDLMFAYSTDPGSLSEGKGYLYSPKTSKTQYVPEFADAAKRVIDSGKGAYEIVATEYGYHIIVCSEVISASTLISETEFTANVNNKDHVAYKFKEYQKDLFIADNVTKITDKFFKDKLSTVVYYESNYEDLISKK